MKPFVAGLFMIIFGMTGAHAQSAAEKQLFDLVNRERVKARLSRLEWNDGLAQAALKHSRLLEQHQDLSHRFAGEAELQDRLGQTGVRFDSVAENVAMAPDVETAHRGLMESPGHRANILHPGYNAVGISIVQRGRELWVTQDFAHVLPSYTEQQFRDLVIARFNDARRARGLHAADIISDARLRKAACAQDMNTDRMIKGLPGAARLMVFSASDPSGMPDGLRKAAADKSIDRVNLGVCLQTGGRAGFSKFWVVAAFFPRTEQR